MVPPLVLSKFLLKQIAEVRARLKAPFEASTAGFAAAVTSLEAAGPID
eukprot:SAG22_NODE_18228_length_290_cov_5.497382_1_plen_47_part_01